ncbi:MAG: hypothetical protein H6601_06810 [Flavobacteriales bacterium]|nr:hypothetical protein [Flavobacteriales bacterium]
MIEFPLSEIVLVADRTYKSCLSSDVFGNQLEQISDEYFEDLTDGFGKLCHSLVHYESPKQLVDNISTHQNSVVVTVYGGASSANRMALVPAICESYGVRYVGADPYGRIVCQDKALSKVLAGQFGLKTPKGIWIDKPTRLGYIEELKPPLVVKPNLEGSSIGINESSLVGNVELAKMMAIQHLEEFCQPVLVEEFVEGREVSSVLIGSRENVDVFECFEVYYENDESYFENHLYTAKDKQFFGEHILHRSANHLLNDKEITLMKNLFKSFGKMDFMRIDGRITADGFVLIELTPDAYLGKESEVDDAGVRQGWNYSETLQRIIHTALMNYHTPYSSYTKS